MSYFIDKDVVSATFIKLNPIYLKRNFVIFLTEIIAIISTAFSIAQFIGNDPKYVVSIQISIWLWFTVIFATFAESIAEAKGKAQAASLKNINAATAKKLSNYNSNKYEVIERSALKIGDLVLVEAGDIIPLDGEVIQGIATVNESAVTGESAPVIRESGGDRSAVTGGTQVISDSIVIKITAMPGRSFLDHMIALVEGSERKPTPNEAALNIILNSLTIVFVAVIVNLWIFIMYIGKGVNLPFLLAFLVTLIPTTISGLLSSVGIAGMNRLLKFNVIAKSGKAVESAGDVNVLLLDKTGTVTVGNRMASKFIPALGVSERDLAESALISSLSDDTAEGRSIVKLAVDNFAFDTGALNKQVTKFIKFSAKTRMSGADIVDAKIRKGAISAVLETMDVDEKIKFKDGLEKEITKIGNEGGTPLLVEKNGKVQGIIYLKDIIKPGLVERFAILKKMGIKTVMITGDNELTAAAIAKEAGIDDFIAEATPEIKLEYIRNEQHRGMMVAMCGDGVNDAPALAQADVGMAMNNGTQAAREASNMVDLDSDPTKIIEVIMIGKQLLMCRGALTCFSIANDIAKYFAIIPALFVGYYPKLTKLNIMNLASPESAVLSAVIFNALIVVCLLPLALSGVKYTPMSARMLLTKNLAIYGLSGIITPFIGIKLIDTVVQWMI
jgi:K+-transporting ATPase ATPase B chain